jgi:hypothetical protein
LMHEKRSALSVTERNDQGESPGVIFSRHVPLRQRQGRTLHQQSCLRLHSAPCSQVEDF